MTNTTYAHFRDVPKSVWRWGNFAPAEIACRGTGKLLINTDANRNQPQQLCGTAMGRAGKEGL